MSWCHYLSQSWSRSMLPCVSLLPYNSHYKETITSLGYSNDSYKGKGGIFWNRAQGGVLIYYNIKIPSHRQTNSHHKEDHLIFILIISIFGNMVFILKQCPCCPYVGHYLSWGSLARWYLPRQMFLPPSRVDLAVDCGIYTNTAHNKIYGQTSNISCTLVGNKLVDHSDVVGASPVGTAPTTSSFST